jgi:ATP/maltotriose-dependent transcriptional regulator MalT
LRGSTARPGAPSPGSRGRRARGFPAFAAPEGAELAAFARKFFRHLFSRAKGPFAPVLDNLHAVPAESALLQVIEAAIGQIPKQSCVIVTSRVDPPVGFARFRVTGEMVCLGWDSLRVDAGELAQIALLRGQPLAAEAVSQLHERTQGWAAGLVLMLEHAKLSGRFQLQYGAEVLTGEATRGQGAGSCTFSNGARYKLHIGS